MPSITNKRKLSDHCTRLLYALVILLVFEGILRKLLPPLRTPIFFLKDLICFFGLIIIFRLKFFNVIQRINSIWLRLFVLFAPLFIITLFKDPILLFYSCKQYLLYIGVGIIAGVSFPAFKEDKFRSFIFFTTLLLIPTTIVGILQNALPPSNWLNLSVGGDSLEAFSADGYLRVASTFSFTGQYSWFLNAETFFLSASYFMPPYFKSSIAARYKSLIYLLLTVMLIIGAFITGGRTAVLGCGGTLALGLLLIGIKRPNWLFSKGIVIVFLCVTSLTVIRSVKPEFFKAYDRRSMGYGNVSHEKEVTDRIIGGFTDWTGWFWEQNTMSVLLGNGLGVMSNGAAQLSSYASQIRGNGFWTEGDVPTTFWEGGLYLAIIWYGFRLTLILLVYKIWRYIKTDSLASAASVPFAYVIINGITGQFGMQPPLSIWWWVAIGIIVCTYQFERHIISCLVKKNKHSKYNEEKSYIY